MPKGTKVHKVYKKLRGKGRSKASAAKIAQSATGQALKTGKLPKKKPASKKPAKSRKKGVGKHY
jgi:hypothetical protein